LSIDYLNNIIIINVYSDGMIRFAPVLVLYYFFYRSTSIPIIVAVRRYT